MAKNDKKDEGIDLYSLTDNVSVLEEIDHLASAARSKKVEINKLDKDYKGLTSKFKELLFRYGKPQKVNGPSWLAIKEKRDDEMEVSRELLLQAGIPFEIIERCMVVKKKGSEFYVLRGKKGVEETQDESPNGENE